MHSVVDRRVSPALHQRCVHFIAQSPYVTLHGRRGIKIASNIKVPHQLTLKWGYYLVPKVIAGVLKSRRGSQKRRVRERYMTMEIMLWVLKMDEGNHTPQNGGDLQKLENTRDGFSSKASRKECSPMGILILASWVLGQTPELQTSNTIKCFVFHH